MCPPDTKPPWTLTARWLIGGRGVGKSFWSAVLLNDTARNYVADSYPRLAFTAARLLSRFRRASMLTSYHAPSREVLDELIERDGYAPEKVWRAVILSWRR